MIKIIVLLILIIGCTYSETDPNDSCNGDEDCWCKSFNGAKFIPGKTPSKCCTVEYSQEYPNLCNEQNKCISCIYY